MKTISIIADDKVGLLSDISYILAKANINIESLNVDVVADKAVILLSLKDPEKARSALEASGYRVNEDNMVIVKLSDKPGELSTITKMLAKDKINIENVLMLSRDGKNTVISIAVDNPLKASKLLKEYLIREAD
jgi:hypothetical protein